MTRRILICLTLSSASLALVVPTIARAQPAQEASPTDAYGSDLSHIRGIPVKVGEHDDYHYSFKRWNLATNPIGALIGFYNVSLSYAVSERIALRGDLNIINPAGSNYRLFEGGVGAPIYFRKMYSGFFLEPGLIMRSEMNNDSGASYGYESEKDPPVFGPQMLVGWHWSWDSGLNVAMALGAGRDLNHRDPYGGDPLFANGYFRVGYMF